MRVKPRTDSARKGARCRPFKRTSNKVGVVLPSSYRGAARPIATLLAGMILVATPAVAQEPIATLTLEEALALARRNNPTFLAEANDAADADWAVRAAYGSLLPSASVSAGAQYQAGGNTRFGVFTGEDLGFAKTPAYYISDYSIGLNYMVGAETLFGVPRERANQRATYARVDAAGNRLTLEVSRQYLAVLGAKDGVELARRELERATENLELAQGRVAVGSAIPLEATQAEVERGRAEVELLRAENLLDTDKLRLVQQIGIELEQDVRLTTELDVFDPRWTREVLVARALERHPQLRALRSTGEASEAAVKIARGAYFPTLQLSAGWSGFTREASNSAYLIQQAHSQAQAREESCSLFNGISNQLANPIEGYPRSCSFMPTREAEAAIVRGNDVFPFDFTPQPFGMQLRVSLPIFQGFTRQRQLEAAETAADDVRHQLRAEELRIRADVATMLANLETAYRAAGLEQRNAELADEQLRLARGRYELGAINFVELIEAETLKARADRARLSAVYAFHDALAALEAAVGEPLRPGAAEGS